MRRPQPSSPSRGITTNDHGIPTNMMTDDNAITELSKEWDGGVQHMGHWVFCFFFPLHNYGVKGWEGYMQADFRYIHGMEVIEDGGIDCR
jgi:hypothetical protein